MGLIQICPKIDFLTKIGMTIFCVQICLKMKLAKSFRFVLRPFSECSDMSQKKIHIKKVSDLSKKIKARIQVSDMSKKMKALIHDSDLS